MTVPIKFILGKPTRNRVRHPFYVPGTDSSTAKPPNPGVLWYAGFIRTKEIRYTKGENGPAIPASIWSNISPAGRSYVVLPDFASRPAIYMNQLTENRNTRRRSYPS